MNKFSIAFSAAILLICLIAVDVFAQQSPEQINVVSLRVEHNNPGFPIDPGAVVTYRNSAGSLVTFNGYTGRAFPSSGSYRFGTTLSSDAFRTDYRAYDTPGGAFEYDYRFTLTSIESEPIILRPTILRRKRDFALSGATVLKGKLEIVKRSTGGPSVVIGVDDDFELRGRYKISFRQSNGNPRTATFDYIVYELNATP